MHGVKALRLTGYIHVMACFESASESPESSAVTAA